MSEPMVIEFIGRVVEGNDGLEAVFDIEGGIAALEAGCSLYASVDLQNSGLTDEDGSCEVYNAADLNRPVYDPSVVENIESLLDDDLSVGAIVIRSQPSVVLPARPRADEENYERMTDYEKGLLHGAIELWDKIDHLNCGTVIGIDQGKTGGDMTAKATFRNEGGKLTLESIKHSEPVSLCAASVGGVRCQSVRATGLFCASHQSSKSRMYLPTISNERRFQNLLNVLPGSDPICQFCFQRGCNGECHGDDMMGGG